jgi:sigma-B regulation protein RsbU (phosphoserine phosphatase)
MSDADSTGGFIEALLEDDAEQLYEKAPCGYFSTTPDGTIIKANHTFLRMTGYGREELIGRRRFVDLLPAGGRIYHETHYAPLLRMQGSVREIALDLVCGDGQRLPVLVNSVMEYSDAGTPHVIRAAVFDATERRSYERALLREKDRATDLARTLQQTLIPPAPPQIPNLDVAAHYRPAGDGSEVGGDFYDVFQVADDDWVVVVGDVRGKGAAAAVVTALARYTLRAAAMQDPSPEYALQALNAALLVEGEDRFCTVAFVRLHQRDGRWTSWLASAGHPLPLLRRGDSIGLVGEPGSLLGVFDDLDLTETELELEPGDVLLLYTDGVPDGRNGQEFYGDTRILEVLARPHPDSRSLSTELLTDVLEFQGGMARDDIAVLAIRAPA